MHFLYLLMYSFISINALLFFGLILLFGFLFLFKLNTYVPVLSFSNNKIFLFGFILFLQSRKE